MTQKQTYLYCIWLLYMEGLCGYCSECVDKVNTKWQSSDCLSTTGHDVCAVLCYVLSVEFTVSYGNGVWWPSDPLTSLPKKGICCHHFGQHYDMYIIYSTHYIKVH